MIARPAWLIHQFETVTSTMDVAARLARFGARDRSVAISAEQTAGRGRSGRSWHAPAGTALFCTIIVRPSVPPERLTTLPLVSGVAVAEALEHITGREVRLKWPNDVWLGSSVDNPKVAGILVTSSLRKNAVDYALVGIGVNVLTEADELPPGATSVYAATGMAASIDEIRDVLLERFDVIYADFVAADGRPSLARWRARAALLGETVTVEDTNRSISGIFIDVDDDGGLLIQEPGGRKLKVVVGELVRGPRSVPAN